MSSSWPALVNSTMLPECRIYDYLVLGLVSEAGEVAGEFKKAIRADYGQITDERRLRIIDELGDVFWYLYAILDVMDVSEDDVYLSTLAKLGIRLESGKIKDR